MATPSRPSIPHQPRRRDRVVLRWWPAKPLGLSRMGSNPIDVDYFFAFRWLRLGIFYRCLLTLYCSTARPFLGADPIYFYFCFLFLAEQHNGQV